MCCRDRRPRRSSANAIILSMHNVYNTRLIAIEVDDLHVDEILFSSIISNALDNAINSQSDLPFQRRHIKLMLKEQDEKLLLSVKNPFKDAPDFVDGIPMTDKKGHGYGTQSIRYMAEKLSGKCQFTIHGDMFILRVVI